MTEGKRIAVRLDVDLRSRLDAATKKSGLDESIIIRLLTEAFCRFMEKHGYMPSTPLEFKHKDLDLYNDLARRLEQLEAATNAATPEPRIGLLSEPKAGYGKKKIA